MKVLKFFKCNRCGNVVMKLVDKGTTLICCGEPMVELILNTVDAAGEKHLPVIKVHGNTCSVAVGEIPHPMEEGHYINFIVLVTSSDVLVHTLKPGDTPEATFYLKDKVIAAYSYCNLHSLWMTKYED